MPICSHPHDYRQAAAKEVHEPDAAAFELRKLAQGKTETQLVRMLVELALLPSETVRIESGAEYDASPFGILKCPPPLMVCPHCQSSRIRSLNRTTDLGYAVFRCGGCGRKFNDRTGTPFNFLEFPTDVVFDIVLCPLRYKLSLRNLAKMFLLRGFEFTHEAVREWEERFAPLLAEQIRRKRKRKVGRRWYADETHIKVKGKWCYLYRAIDRDGNLVDSMLSATRDMAAAQRFFRSAHSIVNSMPTQVTTDGHDSYPRAIRETLGPKVQHHCSAYLNRRIERNHRAIKQRYYPMLGFGEFRSVQRFCRAFEEVQQYFRPHRKQNKAISLSKARRQFLLRALELGALFREA